MRLILALLFLALILHTALLPTQYALGITFGLTPTVEPFNITPVPEPPGSIPPLPTIMPPIAPRTDRAYVPIVFGGSPCAPDLFYWCSGVVR